MFRGSVKSTGYPLHSPVPPSLPLPCVTVCHHISTGLYHIPPQYHIKNTIFWRRDSFNTKCVFCYPTQLLSSFEEEFVKVRALPWMYKGLHVQYRSFLWTVNETRIFPDIVSEKSTNTKFHENPSVGSELFHAYGRDSQAGRHDGANSCLSPFSEGGQQRVFAWILMFIFNNILLDSS